MRVTIKDIANICGVSAGTVDRALNNRTGISEKTKKRILKVAKEMKYQPDFTARSLVIGKTMTIGVVLFDLYNRSFAQLLNAIEFKARELGYFVYITLSDKQEESELNCIEYLVNRKVDGIILFAVNKGEKFDSYLSKFDIPIITIFNYVSEKWEYIGIQERHAMKEAIDYIVGEGYKHFIYISPPLTYLEKKNIYTQEERFKGFLEGLNNNKIKYEPSIIKKSEYIKEMENITFSKVEKTAIVCSTDLYALEVMNYLKKKGVSIPGEVGIMGFDDIDMLKYITPRLTTVKYPIDEIGHRAIESIVNKIEYGEYVSTPLLDYEIIKGESI
ncbi:LacI family DNA-binding transcriptional regulator [Alkalihalobacillus hemicellulosilyticus]|uniref:Transcriptional regulator n=1 Tax=Halalkalibacter hemicellulosilyticusJCM 9152 TaxID=1236971 RepID=W4QEI8_9BACI|nr:LacI family DNA-binding transcriptional regulator [Halalkalibacter hemicellulosilyticus]GAE29774.1 transcriptional regulator [Halalkalibacter hemicellulosilyticusJCM 9152]